MKIIRIDRPAMKSQAGHLAAKMAIQEYFSNAALDLGQIDIVKLAGGRPSFVLQNQPTINPENYSISISHNTSFAAADITDRGKLGIDIETIREFPKSVYDNFLTTEEKNWIESQDNSEKNLYTALFWSLKESYLKAIGIGLRRHPANITIQTTKNKFKISDGAKTINADLWYNIDTEGNYVITSIIVRPIR